MRQPEHALKRVLLQLRANGRADTLARFDLVETVKVSKNGGAVASRPMPDSPVGVRRAATGMGRSAIQRRDTDMDLL